MNYTEYEQMLKKVAKEFGSWELIITNPEEEYEDYDYLLRYKNADETYVNYPIIKPFTIKNYSINTNIFEKTFYSEEEIRKWLKHDINKINQKL